jgi:hypothetical protein
MLSPFMAVTPAVTGWLNSAAGITALSSVPLTTVGLQNGDSRHAIVREDAVGGP